MTPLTEPTLGREEMFALDQFSQAYSQFLTGSYDCLDRIVLNAYFSLVQSPGGLRVWWRRWQGSDEKLDDTHLMRLAGRYSRRVRAYAQAQGIPLIESKTGQRKSELAAPYLPQDPEFVGVFAIIAGRAPAPVWRVRRSKDGRKIINIEPKKPYPYVKQYAFHIIDPEWGHLIIKLSPHPPFVAQIILNGHEDVARQAAQAGLEFVKEGNSFSHVSDPVGLAQIAETLGTEPTIGQLSQVCERWIYSSCLCFALTLEEQAQTGFQYRYSLYQLEYSRNLLFQRGWQMEQVVQGLIDRVRSRLDIKTLKTIFGAKQRPKGRKGHKVPREQIVFEKPSYDLIIFKLHFGQLTLKLYTKGEHILRIEVIVHNTKALPFGRSLPHLPKIAAHLHHILTRFLDHLHCLDTAFVSDDTLDQLPTPTQVGQARVGGLNLDQPRIQAVIEAVMSLSLNPAGFTASDLAAQVRAILGLADPQYTSRQAAYDLKKLRGKGWVGRIGHSRRYEALPEGLRIMSALLILREKVIKPVLAGAAKPKRGPKPKHQTIIDTLYQALQAAMLNLFGALGIVV